MGRPNVNWNVGIAAEKQSTYTNKTLKAGIPFASQVTEPNAKYIIKYDFDLRGATVEMPGNCILEFDGGSLYNGTVYGNSTRIDAPLCRIFGDNLKFTGLWEVEYAYPEWYGAVGNEYNDDTVPFYNTVDNFNSIFLSGRYSIDFRDIELENKAIVGKWRTRSGIIQRNSNVPFALVKEYNYLNRFSFYARNNTEITDVLHFGYANDTYNKFSFTDITNIVFNCDNNSIPFHFNMIGGGNSDLIIKNIRIYHCYIGMWYEYKKVFGDTFGWITQCTTEDVTIYDPLTYGFKWDALSMYDQGTVVDGKTIQTMWCYANNFKDIGVDIIRDGATCFYLGQGMGMLINPVAFNDLIVGQYGVTASSVGYAVEFAPTGSPRKPKMFTWIIGGNIEGQIKNIDYAYMNKISNLEVSLRNNRSSTDTYIVLDSDAVTDVMDLNLFSSRFFQYFTPSNATITTGQDEGGEYLKIERTDPNKDFYLWASFSKETLERLGVGNGIYTLQALAESNLGGNTSGFKFSPRHPGWSYTVDGRTWEARTLFQEGNCLYNSYFVNIDDNSDTALEFAYISTVNPNLQWVKIYNIRLVQGIVGNFLLEKPTLKRKDVINHIRPYNHTYASLEVNNVFISMNSFLGVEMPISSTCSGTVEPHASDYTITLGKPSYWETKRKITYSLYTEDGDVVGNLSIDTDGTVKFEYTTTVSSTVNVFGSM